VNVDRALIIAAAQLSYRAPQEWADFISAFHAYTDDKRDDVVQANTDSLQVTQGRAQACVALRKLFVECRESASRIETRQSQKPSQPRR
jgi:hypothetical protein